jgi:hypothetical protein
VRPTVCCFALLLLLTVLCACCVSDASSIRSNVAMIRTGGGVSVGDKAAQAVAAGVVGIIFVNAGGSEMIAPQLEKGRDPSALSHVPAICITTRVGEQLDKLLHSHQILNDLPAGSGYAPGENAIRIRWWDIAVGWSARRIQKRWKWLLSQRKLQGRLLQQDALLAEQANRLWQKTQEAAAAEAAARHLESKSVSKIAWRRRNPRHSLETISQQQHRLARQDAVLRARIAATGRAVAPLPRVAPAPGCPEKVRQREKRENASRTANMGAESGRQWVDSLPLAGVEKQHAELIEQRQRCASQSQERSQHERGISALQRELALARLARLTRGNTG